MQIVEFETVVKKANARGAGFVSIPKELRSHFVINSQVKAILNSKIPIYAKIREFNSLGFYIPYNIAGQFNLLNNLVKVGIENITGFYTSIGEDGRIYLPNSLAQKLELKYNDIIEIEGFISGIKKVAYPMISVRKKGTTTEYSCLFNRKAAGTSGFFKIIRKLDFKSFGNLLDGLYHGDIDGIKSIVYFGNHHPILINNKMQIKELAHYLGCYFADGTKKGNNWGICASTFEQANYYYKMHQLLIKDAKIVATISFTDTENKDNNNLTTYLTGLWCGNVAYLSRAIKVRIIKSASKPSLKTNKFGCLVMKENRQLTQIYYNRLLQFLYNEVKLKKDKELALDFICGILEGDGSVSSDHGHLTISTNKEESKALEDMLNYAGLKYYVRVEGENKICIHIGLLEIIRTIVILKDRIFKYYPKRRKLLRERLLNTASVMFLLGKNKKTSNWLIGQFNEMNILDRIGNLTKFGVEIKNSLKDFLNE